MIFTSKNTQLNFVNAVGFLTYPSISELGCVNHAFSTRIGGISRGEYTSMNMSFNRGDPDENVLENYRIFCEATGFDFNTLVRSDQNHGTVVRAVTQEDIGQGVFVEQKQCGVDALITNQKGVTLVTHYADCTPIFIVEPTSGCIGLVHAGWRGTVSEICRCTVEAMVKNYGASPEKMVCAIGPAISVCCFEVDKPVADEFLKLTHLDTSAFVHKATAQKYMIDLLECNRQILINSGVLAQNITVSDLCTKCNHDLLFSHRATQGRRGGMIAMMALK